MALIKKIYKSSFVLTALYCLFFFSNAAATQAQFLYLGAAPVFSLTNFNWREQGQGLVTSTQANTQAAVFTGYGFLINRTYLSLEGGAQFGDKTGSNQVRNPITQELFKDKITMSDSYILDFRPGYVLQGKNTLFYGILGANTANFKVSQEDESTGGLQQSKTQREIGIRAGLGYNLGLGHHLMARAEYVYTQFPNFNALNGSIHPNSSEFTLGISAVLDW